MKLDNKIGMRREVEIQSVSIVISELCLKRARQELVRLEKLNNAENSGWGYFPGSALNQSSLYPETIELGRELEKKLLSYLNASELFSLAFIKQSQGEVKDCYGGLHLDPDPLLTSDEEIERILINLHEVPRKLRVAHADRFELEEMGIHYTRHSYSVLQLPQSVPISTIEIPGRTENGLSMARFFSSLYPHVGSTEREGHFVASFERKAIRRREFRIEPAG